MGKEQFDLDPLAHLMGDVMGQLKELNVKQTHVLMLTGSELACMRAIYNDWVNGKSSEDLDKDTYAELAGTIEDIGLMLTGEGGD
jgi:hypothetical protein